MYSRRSFLISVSSLALSPILSGCNEASFGLRVFLLANSLPPQLIKEFRSSLTTPGKLSFTPQPNLSTLSNLLQIWQKKGTSPKKPSSFLPKLLQKNDPIADLVTLGDSWLEQSIQQQLISPLDISQLPQWSQLPPRWQTLVKRNALGMLDDTGQIWGAPYRWGTTAIAYRKDKLDQFDWKPTDWADLWREELRDRISMIDQYREIIGLTLRKLGYSYNTLDLSPVKDLKSQLVALNRQVKFYSSQYYLQPLILGDTWVAVGWSSDILPLKKYNPNIEVVIPSSGTALWSDIWVKPSLTPKLSDLMAKWIDFCWQPKSAAQISLYTDAASPLILTEKSEQIPQIIRDNPLLLVNNEILDQSEFIHPLPPEVQKQYQNLWKEIRGLAMNNG